MWSDEKFRELTPMQPCGQALWLFLLTGPQTGPIPGLFRAGRAVLADELGWDLEAFDEAFAEAFRLGMVQSAGVCKRHQVVAQRVGFGP